MLFSNSPSIISSHGRYNNYYLTESFNASAPSSDSFFGCSFYSDDDDQIKTTLWIPLSMYRMNVCSILWYRSDARTLLLSLRSPGKAVCDSREECIIL